MKLVMRIHRQINIPQITMQVMPALYLLAMLDFLSKANFFSNSNYKMRIHNQNSIIRSKKLNNFVSIFYFYKYLKSSLLLKKTEEKNIFEI